ncbi:pyrimidine 5'-nucleotidase [bacterium]|nr:pyrimidine 5'-nucleotidase [bacterium]OIO89154.1 MAG: pyrimidine 5'-nucleotidase [Anaerolineae bacterium CG2_30_58_95]PIU90706.1 MAG: pyrimidine 5'-nucleotidase [Anaerolineae bacterium CG06_land_8_20_14_3_00_57_67]PIZ26207.1 MAG: pyrimidine 5'-nucleotidase [Chloroflexi bacterium CG_4_10_14_0_8_um_filter_57_5]
MPFSTIFFDLDETLYPASCGLWPAIKERINLYMGERLGLTPEQIEILRDRYFREYGTTLRGLQANHYVSEEDYLAFVHDLPLADYLQPDPELRAMLEALAAQKLIFTNADAAHAYRVIHALGLDGCFNAILDVHVVEPYCKPMRQAFEIALEFAAESDPGQCVVIDDLPHTTRAAREMGFFSILLGENGSGEDADARLARLVDLPKILDGR